MRATAMIKLTQTKYDRVYIFGLYFITALTHVTVRPSPQWAPRAPLTGLLHHKLTCADGPLRERKLGYIYLHGPIH